MSQSLYPAYKIVLVDDEAPWLRSLSIILERSAGINNIVKCPDSRQVMDILATQNVGIVLLDLTMPHLSGEELLPMITEEYPDIPVIVLSGMNQLETAIKCMKLGAFDYFVKTDEEDRLVKGVLRSIKMLDLQRENIEMSSHFLSDTLSCPEAFKDIVTNDPAMLSIFKYLELVTKSNQPILVTGESGVGKELFVRAIHLCSKCSGPLVSVNVAGLDDAIFADTLYGHVRGAFTGANEARKGLVENASGGTLFLDEVGDLSQMSQLKLLRLLQEGEYSPLGSDRPKRLEARIVVATNQDLLAKQAAGTFRKDLYYRLNIHHVCIPPLRDRKDDLPLLVDYFLDEVVLLLHIRKPVVSRELMRRLANYSFPGNVRELKSMIYDAASASKSKLLPVAAFEKVLGKSGKDLRMSGSADGVQQNCFELCRQLPTIHEAIETLVSEALARADNNQTLAARLLGISQPALSKRLKQRQKMTK
ncbi:MAG: sigma-54 dependent transcriptional regulator [Geobacteraceae bacterium]|nr:sigma-54 dependent transcriptional regulator [Geobacteraceae bacterium]